MDAQCPEGGSPEIVEDENVGELACNNCGLVVSDDMLDLGPEWKHSLWRRKHTDAELDPQSTIHISIKG